MIDSKIIEKAESLKVIDKINLDRTVQIRKKVPKFLRAAAIKNEMVILGDGDLIDYYNQPVMVILLNDYLAMLGSVKIPKRRGKKNGV